MDFSTVSPLVSIELIRQLCFEVGQGLGDHFESLGLRFVEVERGHTRVEMPYSEHLVGNPSSGVLHGGAITALLDTACGFSAATVLSDIGVAPTLDLRVDYLGRGELGKTFYGEGKVYRVTKHIIFTEGLVFQTQDKPLAKCTATFARLQGEEFSAMSEQFKAYLDAMNKKKSASQGESA